MDTGPMHQNATIASAATACLTPRRSVRASSCMAEENTVVVREPSAVAPVRSSTLHRDATEGETEDERSETPAVRPFSETRSRW